MGAWVLVTIVAGGRPLGVGALSTTGTVLWCLSGGLGGSPSYMSLLGAWFYAVSLGAAVHCDDLRSCSLGIVCTWIECLLRVSSSRMEALFLGCPWGEEVWTCGRACDFPWTGPSRWHPHSPVCLKNKI